jgi:type II secretory pathway pseudopilin PulG
MPATLKNLPGSKDFVSKRSEQAFGLLETIVAAMLIGVVAVVSIQSLSVVNKNAEATRLFTNARSIVQRNIDNALSVSASTSAIPPILAFTPPGGVVWDDDAGASNIVTVALQGAAETKLVQGTLTRTVVPVPNPTDADIRRITFRLEYTYRRAQPYAYELTTIRAMDD